MARIVFRSTKGIGMGIMLDQVVPWGRSLDEYQRMFMLSASDLAGTILGCGDGPASFNCEMTDLGRHVISCDPIYAFSKEEIAQRVQDTYDPIISQVKASSESYVWRDFRDADALGQHRLQTMQRFLADFEQGKEQERYLAEALPRLPFADQAFDLALCSHLLFLYSEQLSLAFHLASIQELCRVAREVRIFPLLALDCKPSPHLNQVEAYFSGMGMLVERIPVPYEFQAGGATMLRIVQRGE